MVWKWLRGVAEFWVGMGRKRHLTIARLFIICGVGCFAAPEIWVQLAVIVSDRLAELHSQRPPTNAITTADAFGFLCVILGAVIFWYFEKREGVVVQGDGGISLGIPGQGATLKFVLEEMLSTGTKPVSLEGFSEARLNASPRSGDFEFETLFDAVNGVVSLTQVEGETQPEVQVDEVNGKITVRVTNA